MFLERTSNQFINTLVPNTILNKEVHNMDTVESAVSTLPFLPSMYSGVIGVGDYKHTRSSGGSCTLDYGEKGVVKLSLGVHCDDVFLKSKKMMESVRYFEDVAPKTEVIISKADAGIVKTVVIQEKILGIPVCNTPIKKLLSLNALYGMRKIVTKMNKWYEMTNCYDLCGQKSSRTVLGKLLQYIPFFSDNMMIDKEKNVYLADNVLDVEVNDKDSIAKMLPRKLLNQIPLVILNTLIVTKKAYNFLTKNTEEVSQNPAFT